MNTSPKALVGSAAIPRRKLPAHGAEAAGKQAPGQARAGPETESGGVGSPGARGTRVCEDRCASQVTRGLGGRKPGSTQARARARARAAGVPELPPPSPALPPAVPTWVSPGRRAGLASSFPALPSWPEHSAGAEQGPWGGRSCGLPREILQVLAGRPWLHPGFPQTHRRTNRKHTALGIENNRAFAAPWLSNPER